jgi:outer membrane protein, heavy metal efflux system
MMKKLAFLVLILVHFFSLSVYAQEPPASFDLTLREAFDLADARNPQLVAAQRNLKISIADITIAGAIPNPVFGVAYGFFDAYSLFSNLQQVGITQVFELGGKRDARLDFATSQFQLTTLELKALRFDIRSQVRRAYAELAAAEAQENAITAQTQLLDQLVELVRKRFNAGAVSEAELLQAQLARLQVEPQRTAALNRVKRARVQLNALLGNSPKQNTGVRDKGLFNLSLQKTELTPGAGAQIPSLNALLGRAETQRLDLQSTLKQGDIARNQLQLSRALQTPDVQVLLGVTFNAAVNEDPHILGLLTGVNIVLPIFYNQNGEVVKAEATIEQANLNAIAVRLQISAEVQTAYQDLTAAQQNVRQYQEQLLLASAEVLRLARRSYEVGKSALASVILAQQADQQIRTSYLDAVVTYQNAWADLEKAVGEPLVF